MGEGMCGDQHRVQGECGLCSSLSFLTVSAPSTTTTTTSILLCANATFMFIAASAPTALDRNHHSPSHAAQSNPSAAARLLLDSGAIDISHNRCLHDANLSTRRGVASFGQLKDIATTSRRLVLLVTPNPQSILQLRTDQCPLLFIVVQCLLPLNTSLRILYLRNLFVGFLLCYLSFLSFSLSQVNTLRLVRQAR